jgi:hypothetical protein
MASWHSKHSAAGKHNISVLEECRVVSAGRHAGEQTFSYRFDNERIYNNFTTRDNVCYGEQADWNVDNALQLQSKTLSSM